MLLVLHSSELTVLCIHDYSATKTAVCLLSNTCMGEGVLVLARYELKGEGAQFSNIGESPSEGSTFSMGSVFGMLILDTVLYLLITW